jgi:oligopeptide transport system substrate-binding protein
MRVDGRALFPYLALALLGGATWWALSFATLPPADFTYVNGTEIKTVDPAIVTGVPEGRVLMAITEGLCNWDPRTLAPIPGVAESWDISEDKKTYTFHLRDNALWSDGSPVVADDFWWSFRRMLHPELAAEYSYELWYITNAEKFTSNKKQVGDAVEIELPERAPGARPFAGGQIVKGKLMSIEGEAAGEAASGDDPVYVVEIEGKQRRFHKDGTKGEPYKWLLIDFDSVAIRVLDPHTLQITLDHPVPYFLNLMGFYPLFPVNRRCIETFGSPNWTKPENIVTNGAFRIKFRRIRDRVRLVKSDNYWDREHIYLNVVDFLAVESDTTALNMLLTGMADGINGVPLSVVPELLKMPDFPANPMIGTYFYKVNVTKPGLTDPRVRRALNMAMDKRSIVEQVTRARQPVARSLVPEAMKESVPYTPALSGAYNVAEARRLLTEAGYPGGEGLPKIVILYNTLESHRAIAETIQDQWKRNLGIDVGLQNQEWAAYQAAQRELNYQVARMGWIADYADPGTFLKMFVTDGTNNQTGWGNAEYDRLVDAAQEAPDLETRMKLFHDAEVILMDEMPVLPIYGYTSPEMCRTYVKGHYPNNQDVHPLNGVSIDLQEKARVFQTEGLR